MLHGPELDHLAEVDARTTGVPAPPPASGPTKREFPRYLIGRVFPVLLVGVSARMVLLPNHGFDYRETAGQPVVLLPGGRKPLPTSGVYQTEAAGLARSVALPVVQALLAQRQRRCANTPLPLCLALRCVIGVEE